MNISELIEKIKSDNRITGYEHIHRVTLMNYKDEFLKCDELSEVTELEFIPHPTIEVNGRVMSAQTIKINGNPNKIVGKLHLLEIFETPAIGIYGRAIMLRGIFNTKNN